MAGLWQVPLNWVAGELTLQPSVLSGVVFYQHPTTKTLCGVKAHCRKNVYGVAYDAIAGTAGKDYIATALRLDPALLDALRQVKRTDGIPVTVAIGDRVRRAGLVEAAGDCREGTIRADAGTPEAMTAR